MTNFGSLFVGFLIGIAATTVFFNMSRSQLVKEAIAAEKDGRTINNMLMRGMYPKTFNAGRPPYLERDFEAGADFVCDEIQAEFKMDMCSQEGIGWR